MWDHRYDVILQTPIGARYGTMTVVVDRNKVDGILDILKKANPFHGTINAKGTCQIKGELTTLIRTIPYDAVGRITKESLALKLNGEQESFEISGTVSAPAPLPEREKV